MHLTPATYTPLNAWPTDTFTTIVNVSLLFHRKKVVATDRLWNTDHEATVDRTTVYQN